VHERRIIAVGDDDYVLHEAVLLPKGTQDGLRVGMELELVEGLDNVEFVGLGPWENYPDRRFAALLGRWAMPVDDMEVPYIWPQESGTRGEVSHTKVFGPAGTVRTEHATPLHFSAGRRAISDLEGAGHIWEVPRGRTAIVHLDVVHRGVGTALLGPDTLPEYRLIGDRYEWSWRLTLASA
jgi:beta-galactosidase